jgi:hypothetical protein
MTELMCNPQGLVASSCDHGSEHSCTTYVMERYGTFNGIL